MALFTSFASNDILYSTKDSMTVNIRIVLHSETDLLRVITNLSAKVQTLSAKVKRQELELGTLKNDIAKLQSVAGGSTYVRWGKEACPSNGTETVYSGYAAGSHYTSSGAAANYLCLSPDPLWAHTLTS